MQKDNKDSALVDQYISQFTPEIQERLLKVRELIKVIGFQFKTHLKYLFFYRDTNVSITTVKPRTGVTSANQGQESG